MKKLLAEFKAFINRGNVVDMAVGVMIGAAFKSIVDSVVNDLISPLIGLVFKADFNDLVVVLREEIVSGEEVIQEVQNYLTYGNFIAAIINFFILALVVFWLVKGLNKLAEAGKKQEAEAAAAEPPAPPAPSAEETLLTEIRDLLKDK